MLIEKTSIAGALAITLPFSTDTRGTFTKTFHRTALLEAGIDFELKESYYSFSKKDVIRGMHFQMPPDQHSKIVFCPVGAILDVIVDLRRDSPTYGTCCSTVLSEENQQAYYIPTGCAHGFKSLTEMAMTYYLVSSEYNPTADTGIAFDSIGFDWQVDSPIMSVRDRSFTKLADFVSPF